MLQRKAKKGIGLVGHDPLLPIYLGEASRGVGRLIGQCLPMASQEYQGWHSASQWQAKRLARAETSALYVERFEITLSLPPGFAWIECYGKSPATKRSVQLHPDFGGPKDIAISCLDRYRISNLLAVLSSRLSPRRLTF